MIQLILLIVILGVGLYLIEKHVPMDGALLLLLRIVVVLLVVMYIWNAFGLPDIPLPKFQRH